MLELAIMLILLLAVAVELCRLIPKVTDKSTLRAMPRPDLMGRWPHGVNKLLTRPDEEQSALLR